MATVTNELIYSVLQRVQADVADVKVGLRDLTQRVGHVETGLAHVEVRMAHVEVRLAELSVRMDRQDEKLDRVMRRLDLSDVTGP